MKKLVFMLILSFFWLDTVYAGDFIEGDNLISEDFVQGPRRVRVSPQTLPKPVRDSLEIGFTGRNTRVISAHQLYENGTMIYEINVVEGRDNFIKKYDVQGRKLDEKEGDPEMVRIRVRPWNLPQPILNAIDQHSQDRRSDILTAYQKVKNGKIIYVVNFLANNEEWTKVYDMYGKKLDIETEELEKAGARKRIDARALPRSILDNISATIRFAYQIREGDQLMYEVSYLEDGGLKTTLFDEDGGEIKIDEGIITQNG